MTEGKLIAGVIVGLTCVCVLKIKVVLEVRRRLPFIPNPAGLNYYSRQQ